MRIRNSFKNINQSFFIQKAFKRNIPFKSFLFIFKKYMSYSRLQKRIEYVNQVMKVGPQSFYVGLPFVRTSIACFLAAVFTKTKRTANKKEKKTTEQKKIIMYVFGSFSALLGLFLWTPFFHYLSIRYF